MQCFNCDSEKLVYDVKTDSYVCLNCNYRYPKQYFFISHSHLDIEKVRIIRNIIEETFFYEPILFFLKCLSNDEEIKDLVQREIYERIWFVYCKSENAEKSKYVQEERAYLENLIANGKQINRIDVELDKFNIWDKECYEYIRNQIAYQIQKTKIFLSYTARDRDFARMLRDQLERHGYSVWSSEFDIALGTDFVDSVESALKRHSYKDGIFMPIVSVNSMKSYVCRVEIEEAHKNNAFIVPIVLQGANFLELVNQIADSPLKYTFYLSVDMDDFDLAIHKIIDHLKVM